MIRADQKIFHASYFGCTIRLYGCISCAVTIPSTRLARSSDHSFSLKKLLTPSSVRPSSFEICSDSDSFEHTVVFVIRYIERRTDDLLDDGILDYSPHPSGFDGIQFESEWSFLRSLTPKKKSTPTQTVTPSAKNGVASPLNLPSRPSSPVPSSPPPSNRSFASFKKTFSRSRGGSSGAPLQSMFQDMQHSPSGPNPDSVTSFFDALQTFLVLSGANPAFITQIWSQVFYWLACETSPIFSVTLPKPVCVGEIFNRILTRKKYLCRCVQYLTFQMNLN